MYIEKASFLYKKYPVTINTQDINCKQCISYLNPSVIGFLKIIGVQIQINITFGTAWIVIKISKVRKLTLKT